MEYHEMAGITKDQVMEALRTVQDPELQRR